MENPYYSPEDSGLEVIGDIEWDNEDWQFNMTAVWKDEQGHYFIASDSGCSCQVSFEDIKYMTDLDGPHDASGIVSLLKSYLDERKDSEYGRSYADLRTDVLKIIDRLDLIGRVQL